MANAIDLGARYAAMLDAALAAASKSGVLDVNKEYVGDFTGPNSAIVNILSIALSGFGNYDRANSKYPAGSVSATWTPYELTYDRAVQFTIDTMDDLESGSTLVNAVMAEFARLQEIPEVDAARFSAYLTGAGVSTPETLTDANIIAAIERAQETADENGFEWESCKLFVRPAVKTLLKKAGMITSDQVGAIDRRVSSFDGAEVITVPTARFTKGVTMTADGYTPGVQKGNFLVVQPSSVFQVAKHREVKHILPGANQGGDGHLLSTRLYHDALVLENKAGGVIASVEPIG